MFYTALILGFGGSFHCLGMCGPIAMSLHYGKGRSGILSSVLYNAGRIFTYMLLGALIGFAGKGLYLASWQNIVSLITGVLLISISLFTIMGWRWKKAYSLIGKMVRKPMSKFMKKRSMPAMFIIGVLNGFLPCGMVYMAVIASMALGDVAGAVAFMFLFGVGTLPMMLFTAYIKSALSNSVRYRMTRFAPAFTLVVGVLFALRGMELGVPYISPETTKMELQAAMSKDGIWMLDPVTCH